MLTPAFAAAALLYCPAGPGLMSSVYRTQGGEQPAAEAVDPPPPTRQSDFMGLANTTVVVYPQVRVWVCLHGSLSVSLFFSL